MRTRSCVGERVTDSRLHGDDAFDDETHQPLLDWSDLLMAETPDDLLIGLGHALRPYVSELILKSTEGGTRETLAEWRDGPASGSPPHQVEIGGRPQWRLRIRFADQAPQIVLIERALMAVEAWRTARQGLADAQGRVEARTRELDLIQALGRGAAEARDLDSLFRYAIDLLQSAEDIDVAVAAYAVGRRRTVLALESRPVDDDARASLSSQAIRLLGWTDEDRPPTRIEQFSGWDDSRGMLREWEESSLVVLPVPRREHIAALSGVASVTARRPRVPCGCATRWPISSACTSTASSRSTRPRRIVSVRSSIRCRRQSSCWTATYNCSRPTPAAVQTVRGARPGADGIDGSRELDSLGMSAAVERVSAVATATSDHGEIRHDDDRTFALSVSRLAGDRSDANRIMVLVIGDVSETTPDADES